jgi:hypothetical protein
VVERLLNETLSLSLKSFFVVQRSRRANLMTGNLTENNDEIYFKMLVTKEVGPK